MRPLHKPDSHQYIDDYDCPRCGVNHRIVRLKKSAGKITNTWCHYCFFPSKVLAGPVLENPVEREWAPEIRAWTN